jgi:hypothetical protein
MLLVTIAACNHDADKHVNRAHGRGTPPDSVSVSSADVTLGFVAGALRSQAKVSSFRVTKYPITVRDFRDCVSVAACAEPSGTCEAAGGLLDHSNYADPAALDTPVTCMSAAQAQAYCAWVGGRLPTASEWLLAARGPSVQKYSWGSDAPTCERFPMAEGILADARSCCGDVDSCTTNDLVRVGTHRAGASPAGVEDLLFARGELVDSDTRSSLTSCGGGECVMVGRGAAIEGLVPAPADEVAAVTFRCAFDGGKQ